MSRSFGSVELVVNLDDMLDGMRKISETGTDRMIAYEMLHDEFSDTDILKAAQMIVGPAVSGLAADPKADLGDLGAMLLVLNLLEEMQALADVNGEILTDVGDDKSETGR